jgi:hypothetical protein
MITLAELAKNANDKLVQGFINELITDSYLLSTMTFDDCLSNNGQSDLVYAYKRVMTPASAAFRALNTEGTSSEPTIERFKTSPAIINSQYEIDRVAAQASSELVLLRMQEAKNAIIRKFSHTVINGDTEEEELGFDGLSKALTDSSTEVLSAVDLTTAAAIKANAFDFAYEMDELLSLLSGDPGALLVGRKGKNRLVAVARALGIYQVTEEGAGRRVERWDGIPIQYLKDDAVANGDIYAVRFGMDEFHGITLSGGNAISVCLPKFDEAGAIKKGDAEFVVGCALKATKAAGVLREFIPEPPAGGQG